MKAELTKDGYIKVTAETIVEAWALNGVWPVGNSEREKNQDRVIVDCSILSEDLKINHAQADINMLNHRIRTAGEGISHD